MQSGGQEISVGNGCEAKEVIVHEILHALGFYHEQSRADRDEFVEIFWKNIKPRKTTFISSALCVNGQNT